MKTIKTFLLAGMTAILLTPLTSCTDYQDEIDALTDRVIYLESLASKVNENLESFEKIFNILNKSGYIKEINPTKDGYNIKVAWISKGADGNVIITQQELEIHDGVGIDITIKQDPSDGKYYWWMGNDWLTDTSGNRVQANGTTPKVRINPTTNYWEISYDEGKTWEDTGVSATGQDGKTPEPLVKVLNVDYVKGEVTLSVLGPNGERSTIIVPLIP